MWTAILLMSCWFQNRWHLSQNNLFKMVTFPESSAIRMSCLSFCDFRLRKWTDQFVQNARGQKKFPSQAKDEAGNGQKRGCCFEQPHKGQRRKHGRESSAIQTEKMFNAEGQCSKFNQLHLTSWKKWRNKFGLSYKYSATTANSSYSESISLGSKNNGNSSV